MFDPTVKELSPKALRWLVTAAKLPAGGPEYVVAVSYIAQGPVTVDRDGNFQTVPCSDMDADGMCPLELMLRALDDGSDDFRQFIHGERGLYHKARVTKAIRFFEFPNPKGASWFNRLLSWKHKRQWAEFLKKMEAAMPPRVIMPLPTP